MKWTHSFYCFRETKNKLDDQEHTDSFFARLSLLLTGAERRNGEKERIKRKLITARTREEDDEEEEN